MKVKLKKLQRDDEGTSYKEQLSKRQKTQGIHDNRAFIMTTDKRKLWSAFIGN